MLIHIKQLAGPEGSLEVDGSDTIVQLKIQIQEKWKLAASQQRLVLKGRTLEDEKTLRECGVEDGQKLFVSVRKAAPTGAAPSNRAVPMTTQQTYSPVSAALNSAAGVLNRLVGQSAAQPKAVDFWDQLYAVLLRHFREEDARVLLQRYRADYKLSLNRLSLDQIERMARLRLQASQ